MDTKSDLEMNEGVVKPSSEQLSKAGSLLAAAWFIFEGCGVSWPLEPCRFDLVVTKAETTQRVQVKTTVSREGSSWKVYLSNSRKGGRLTYSNQEIDSFFILDGDLNCYLIPISVVVGKQAINLSNYRRFQLPRLLGR